MITFQDVFIFFAGVPVDDNRFKKILDRMNRVFNLYLRHMSRDQQKFYIRALCAIVHIDPLIYNCENF